MASDSKFYSVTSGKKTGVYSSWSECKTMVDGVEGAKFKIFTSEDAAYEHLCNASSSAPTASSSKSFKSVKKTSARKERLQSMTTKFYAVAVGRKPGIYRTHAEMMEQVAGFEKETSTRPSFKAFESDVEAQKWIEFKTSGPKSKSQDKPKEKYVKKSTDSAASSSRLKSYYAVAAGRKTGVFDTWNECKAQTDGFENSIFLKLDNFEDAEAFSKLLEKSDKEYPVRVFTDGSYVDGKAGYAFAVYIENVLVYEEYGPVKIDEPQTEGKNSRATNNTAELTAILKALSYIDTIEDHNDFEIVTDSGYSICCVCAYHKHWNADRRARTPNISLIDECAKFVGELRESQLDIRFTHIHSHQTSSDFNSDISHNNHVDELAAKGMSGESDKVDHRK